ncbi:MAG: hypothetical protein H7039_06065 [Bryobacteraceae bacterium]|nr:hypothetical protein [Bryobacteraceae bacterium]
MSLIDALLLGAILGVCGGWILGRPSARRFLILTPFALFALVAVQLAIEGFYWQFLPAYVLVLATTLLAVRHRTASANASRVARTFGRISLVTIMLAAVAAWIFLPAPQLTKPGGRYSVGTEIYRWIDASRSEEATASPVDKRNVIVQAWYPVSPNARGAHSIYMDGLSKLPSYVSLIPGFVLRRYDRIDTGGVLGAAISTDRSKWPVVVFSPGYGAPRAFYTSLVTGLASKGFVVLAIDHPYEAAVTELADGRIATTVEKFSNSDPDRRMFMTEHLDLRAADVTFVLDQLSRPGVLGRSLYDHLELERIAAIGHSFGGATAAVAMDRDTRIKAAANIDGSLYGSISAKRLRRPFLLLESDHAETGHSDWYLLGNQRLLENLGARGYRYEIRRANHFSFTDAPLFLSLPARFGLEQLIGGGRGPTQTHQATSEILAAFLQESLTGVPAAVDAVAARYGNIVGGSLK